MAGLEKAAKNADHLFDPIATNQDIDFCNLYRETAASSTMVAAHRGYPRATFRHIPAPGIRPAPPDIKIITKGPVHTRAKRARPDFSARPCNPAPASCVLEVSEEFG
jgi:hypothetical protein